MDLNTKEIKSNLQKYSSKMCSIHRKYILQQSGWQEFTNEHYIMLQEELSFNTKRLAHPKTLLPIATTSLINKKVELPSYYIFVEIISDLYKKIEDMLVAIVDKSLTENQKSILNDLVYKMGSTLDPRGYMIAGEP